MPRGNQHPSPISLAALTSVIVALALVFFTLALAGSYALTLHAIDTAKQTSLATAQRQAHAALTAAKGECVALEALDRARVGINFGHVDASHPSELYLTRMTGDIHQVVVKSDCSDILAGHFPPGEANTGG